MVAKAQIDSLECLWEDDLQSRKHPELQTSQEGQLNRPPVWLPCTHGDFLATSASCTGLEVATKVPDRQRLPVGKTAGQTASQLALDGSLRAVLHSPPCSPRCFDGGIQGSLTNSPVGARLGGELRKAGGAGAGAEPRKEKGRKAGPSAVSLKAGAGTRLHPPSVPPSLPLPGPAVLGAGRRRLPLTKVCGGRFPLSPSPGNKWLAAPSRGRQQQRGCEEKEGGAAQKYRRSPSGGRGVVEPALGRLSGPSRLWIITGGASPARAPRLEIGTGKAP